MLDVGAKSTLRGRRQRRAPGATGTAAADTRGIAAWPAPWRDLLIAWIDGAQKRRWETLLALAGNAGFNLAHELLDALLRAGLIETDEARERGQWKIRQVSFLDPPALRAALGLPDVAALRAELEAQLATPPADPRLAPLWAELAEHPPARGLERAALLRKLDNWLAENRYGTRRDFALYARGGTKSVSSAEWQWLAALPTFTEFGIETHTPALWLRAPLTLHVHCNRIDLSAVPDLIGLSPATLKQLHGIEGDIGCWRLVENRTSFERVAREHGAADGVIWLPGFAPGWWKDCVARLLDFKPAPAHIACDPDPAGINIALDAATLWQARGLDWTTWNMAVSDLKRLNARAPLSDHDKVVLQQLFTRSLPAPLQELAQWMLAHGQKGEQEGFL